MTCCVRVLAGFVMCSGVAFAEARDLPRPPNLLSLERGSHADLELGAGFLDDGRAYDYALEAEYEIAPALHIGLVVPAGTIQTEGAGQQGQRDADGILLCGDGERESGCPSGESTTDLGNVGVGVRKVRSGGEAARSWHVGAGLHVWLPTSTQEVPEEHPRFPLFDFPLPQRPGTQPLAPANHPMNPGRFEPDRVTLRPALAAGMGRGSLLGEAEVGLDAFFPTGSADTEVMVRGGLALGVGSTALAGYAEVGRWQVLTGPDDAAGASYGATSLALGVRTRSPGWLADLAVQVPVDDAIGDGVDLGIRATGGLRF